MADDSIEGTSPSLLCTENLNLDDFDDEVVDPTEMRHVTGKDLNFMSGRSEELIGLCCFSEEEFEMIIVKEMENLPKGDYLERLRKGDLDMRVRRAYLEWIFKAHTHFGFTEQCFALAVNYYDRFMSIHELPRGADWANQLLAVACLSLAAKVEEAKFPLRTVNLQVGEPKSTFNSEDIQRMELMVLNSLGWKLHVYTPCTFINHFLIKMANNQLQLRPLIANAVQIILRTMKGIDFLDFRPCEIAAGVALSVLGKTEAMEMDTALSCFKQIDKDRVLKCVEMIHEQKLVSLSSSPNGMLEAASMSCKTDEQTVGSCPNTTRK